MGEGGGAVVEGRAGLNPCGSLHTSVAFRSPRAHARSRGHIASVSFARRRRRRWPYTHVHVRRVYTSRVCAGKRVPQNRKKNATEKPKKKKMLGVERGTVKSTTTSTKITYARSRRPRRVARFKINSIRPGWFSQFLSVFHRYIVI